MTIDILISTMFRTDLDFLKPMFVNNAMEDFNLIIVNQTNEDQFLRSNNLNIKVVNSTGRGSSASRNIALRNSNADICLMADDDIVYLPDLKRKILQAYSNNPKVDMISFEAIDDHGNPYTDYHKEGIHNKKSLKKIYTWVITFRREVFAKRNIYFNYYFGGGSTFRGEDEYVFLRQAFDTGLTLIHNSEPIVMHPTENSGKLMGSDNGVAQRAAAHQRFYGNLSYLWLLKYLFFLIRHDYITMKQLPHKFRVGIGAIALYKELDRTGQIDKIDEN